MDERKSIGKSLLLAVAPALVSSMMTGVASWSLAVRDAKKASTEQATEKDQVLFTALRDRIAAIEGSVQDMTKVMEKVATGNGRRIASPQANTGTGRTKAPAKPARADDAAGTVGNEPKTEPSASPVPSREPDADNEGRRVLFEVLDRLKDQLPSKPLPKKVEDLPLYGGRSSHFEHSGSKP